MSCPGAELLSSLLAGNLPQEQSRELEDHVRSCDRCSEAIASRTRELQAASAPASSPPLPRRLGPYEVVGLLGQGGMGIVYRAHHVATDRQVALKTVSARNRWACAGLREEIAFLRNASHPGIVEILDYDLQGPEPWYAMEVLEGETLESRHREVWKVERESVPMAVHAHAAETSQSPSAPRPAAGGRLLEMLTLYARLCEPLAFAHREGIVHCDSQAGECLPATRARAGARRLRPRLARPGRHRARDAPRRGTHRRHAPLPRAGGRARPHSRRAGRSLLTRLHALRDADGSTAFMGAELRARAPPRRHTCPTVAPRGRRAPGARRFS